MVKYLIDNNVISNYFSAIYSKNGMKFIADVFDQTPTISVVNEIEALSWKSFDRQKEAIVKNFIIESNILALSQPIINKTIVIRRSKKIKTPDAIIASTAIVNNLILITSDAGFNKIPELNIIDPLKL